MEKSKLIYEIRERLNAISDDRHIDDRFILHLIKNTRNSFVRKLMTRNISFNSYGLTQDHHVSIEPSTRSLSSNTIMDCKVLRSI